MGQRLAKDLAELEQRKQQPVEVAVMNNRCKHLLKEKAGVCAGGGGGGHAAPAPDAPRPIDSDLRRGNGGGPDGPTFCGKSLFWATSKTSCAMQSVQQIRPNAVE